MKWFKKTSELGCRYFRGTIYHPADSDYGCNRAGQLGSNIIDNGSPQYIDCSWLGAYQRLGFNQKEKKPGMDIPFADTSRLDRLNTAEKQLHCRTARAAAVRQGVTLRIIGLI